MEKDKQRNVNLMDLLILILKHKGLILSFVLLGSVAAITYGIVHYRSLASVTDPLRSSGIYYSECIIEPDGVSVDKLKTVLMSRDVLRRMMEESKLKRVFQDALLYRNAKTGNPEMQLTLDDIHQQMTKQLIFKQENSLVKLTFCSPTAEYPPQMLNFFLKSLSDAFREKGMRVLEPKRMALQRHLLSETDPVLKAKISERIIQLIEIEKMAKDASFYGFDVIDPPSPSRILSDTQLILGQTKPNYVVIVLLCMLASFMLAVFLAFCIEKLRTAKSEDPERYEQLKKYLHLRAK
jgi:uncharacterized protein involved in exopolysaccharide biosynthesis